MRFVRLAPLVALATVGCLQQGSSPAVSAAARAMGGRDRILAVRTLVLDGRGEQLNFGQNHTPSAETKFAVTSYRWATDFPNRRHLIDVTREPRFVTAVTTPQRIRLGLDGSVGFGILPNGNMTRAGAQAAADRAHNRFFHPIGFLQAALDPSTVVTEEASGADARRIRINVGGQQYAMIVDNGTSLPTRIETVVDQPMLGDVTLVMELSDYQDAAGLRVPGRMAQRYENLFTLSDIRLASTRVNEDVGSLAATDSIRGVTLPAGPPAPNIVVEELAPGVWSIAGQTHHTIAVEQANRIVLIEAPQSDARTRGAIARARELRPGKPVDMLVNTHHHFDHSGGLRAAMSEGLTILTHEGNRDFYERTVAARRHTIAPDALSRSSRPPRIEAVGDKHVIADAQRPIELYHVANPHSGTMLVAYLPAERLLIQADLYNPPAANAPPPPGFPFVASLLENIQRRGLQVDRVVGIHGRVVPLSDLQAAASRAP